MGLVDRPVDIHISLIRSHCSGVGWRRLEKGEDEKDAKRALACSSMEGISMMAMSGNTTLTA